MNTHRYGNAAPTRLRCLSVKDPWAAEIAAGKKTVELRSYPIPLGPLGICSTASKWASGRLLCVVDVVEVLPPGHPWLAAEGIRGLYGLVLKNPRAAGKGPAVSGKQGIWYLEVTGEWADLIAGGAPREPRSRVRGGPDLRTRADKLRDLANHPTTNENERASALAELAKMGESARAPEPAAEPSHAPAPYRRPQGDEEQRARQEQQRARVWQETIAEAIRAVKERELAREARRQAEAVEAARIERERSAERERRARAAQEAAAPELARQAEEIAKKKVIEGSPFRIRAGAGDDCPACKEAGAIACTRASEDPLRRRYACGTCGQAFDVVKSGDVLMYYRDVKFKKRGYG